MALHSSVKVPGKCPVVRTREDKHPGQKLDLGKLAGDWKTIYDTVARTQGLHCQSLKLRPAEGGNPAQLHALFGQKFHESDVDFQTGEVHTEQGIYYDDDTFFTFNHPSDNTVAAVQTKEELEDPGHAKWKKELDQQLVPLSDEQRSSMSPAAIKKHDVTMDQLRKMRDQMQARLDKYDPFEHKTSVLDTDYENFLVLYDCIEKKEDINASG